MTMRSALYGLALAAALALPAVPALAQAPAPSAQRPAAVQPAAVVAQVREVLATRYVLPERRPALDAVLAQGLASGRYRVDDPVELAALINADLERVGRDKHLSFTFDPAQAAMAAARGGETPDEAAYERQVRQGNHGVRELRLLPGNIRYLDYSSFAWIGAESRTALDTAARFLAGGDAVIVDLRGNGGGSPEAVQYLVSHFMAPGRPLMTFHMNGAASEDRTASVEVSPATRMAGKPLYVLIGPGSASAAEEFAGHVAGYRLGELVGETTAGAGFRNDVVPIDGRFMLSVSVGRAVLAATGRDWEGVGHAATLPAKMSTALPVAQAHALRRLAEAAGATERAPLIAMAEASEALAAGRAPGRALEAYAGRFGDRTIRVEGGRLHHQRDARVASALIPLGGDAFALEGDPSTRLNFSFTGDRAQAFTLDPAGGPSRGRYERGA